MQVDELAQHRTAEPGHVPAQGGLPGRFPGAAEHDQLAPVDRRARAQRQLEPDIDPAAPADDQRARVGDRRPLGQVHAERQRPRAAPPPGPGPGWPRSRAAWPGPRPAAAAERQVVAGQRARRRADQAQLAPTLAAHLPQRQRRRAGQLAQHAARLDDRGRPGDQGRRVTTARAARPSAPPAPRPRPRSRAGSVAQRGEQHRARRRGPRPRRAPSPTGRAPTSGARSVLLITSRSERVTPGPPLRGTLSPPATSMTKIWR